jgi:hypothetical protein
MPKSSNRQSDPHPLIPATQHSNSNKHYFGNNKFYHVQAVLIICNFDVQSLTMCWVNEWVKKQACARTDPIANNLGRPYLAQLVSSTPGR